MAMIAIRVPEETAKMLEQMAASIPGDNQSTSDMHITLVSLGDGIPVETLAKAMEACHSVTSKTSPFSLEVREISSFDPGNNGTPIILPVESKELIELQSKILEALNEFGVEYSKKWPEFKPHVTLSYVEGMKGEVSLPHPIRWGAFEVEIFGADHGSGGMSITLPLEMPNTELKLRKIAASIIKQTRPVWVRHATPLAKNSPLAWRTP